MKNDNNSEWHEQLNRVPRKNVFSTPENYFDKLPLTVSGKIHSNTDNSYSLFNHPIRIFTLAGIAAAAFVAIFWFSNSRNEQPAAPELTYDDIVNSGAFAEMDESIILEAYSTATDSTSSSEISASDNEHLKEYLIENNTDISLIINEL